jgi:hypothetical protein
MAKRSPLKLVQSRADPDLPPAQLGSFGAALWRAVLDETEVSAIDRLALTQACVMLDRAEELTNDPKTELQCRAFATRVLQRLKPPRGPRLGRRPGPIQGAFSPFDDPEK